MTKKTIHVGLIGYGAMGKAHSYAYRNLPLYYDNLPFRVNLAAVCSGHLATAERARDDLGYGYATDDYMRIIEDPAIEVVNICTPNNLHYDMLMAALAAGKHIYCDKPMVTNDQEAAAVVKAAQAASAAGKTHQVAFNNRFLTATLRARQLIDEGRIGRILSFRAEYLHAGSVDPHRPIGWKLDQAIGGGGVLFDLGSHVLDLMYFLMGEYAQVFAKNTIAYPMRPNSKGEMVPIRAEDTTLMLVEMKNGATGVIEATKVATGANDELRFEIHGDCGALRFNLMDPNWLEFYDNNLPEQTLGGERGYKKIECVQRYEKPGGGFPAPKASIGWIRSHVHCLYRFLDCVDRGQPASPSLLEGAYIQHVMTCAYESAATSRWISVD